LKGLPQWINDSLGYRQPTANEDVLRNPNHQWIHFELVPTPTPQQHQRNNSVNVLPNDIAVVTATDVLPESATSTSASNAYDAIES
jgi:hypothetical protein